MQFYNESSFSIHEAADAGDRNGITECLRSAFGEGYIKKDMYRPERIEAMQKSGEINLFVADCGDETAGVMGWERVSMFPDTAELCTLAVKPQYSGNGLGETLIRHAFEIVKATDAVSVFSYPIASHLRAQSCIGKLDFVCCGFLPSVFSTELFDNGIKKHDNPKDSLAVVAKNLRKQSAGRLNLKKEYHALAESTYKALSADIALYSESACPEAAETECAYRFDDTHKTLYINIDRIGWDFAELADRLASRRDMPYFTANLCLNISDSAAVWAAEILELRGFFFTGFHPLCGDREYCIYHFSGNVSFDIDDLDYTEGQGKFADCIRLHTKGEAGT